MLTVISFDSLNLLAKEEGGSAGAISPEALKEIPLSIETFQSDSALSHWKHPLSRWVKCTIVTLNGVVQVVLACTLSMN